MEKKILYVNWGGLGDHLSFSTLPEIFTNLGYEFYISDKSLFRSQEIYDLVWGTNPHVIGITSENANCGHLDNWGVSDTVDFNKEFTTHKNIELIYGVNNESKYAKIYYQPNNINEFNDYIVLDLNSVSVKEYDNEKIKSHLLTYKNEKFLVILTNDYPNLVVPDDFFSDLVVEFITTKNIFHYVDLIFSCKKFMCVWSGSSILSSSIKNYYKNDLDIECFKKIIDDKCPEGWGITNKSYYWYDNIKYIMI